MINIQCQLISHVTWERTQQYMCIFRVTHIQKKKKNVNYTLKSWLKRFCIKYKAQFKSSSLKTAYQLGSQKYTMTCSTLCIRLKYSNTDPNFVNKFATSKPVWHIICLFMYIKFVFFLFSLMQEGSNTSIYFTQASIIVYCFCSKFEVPLSCIYRSGRQHSSDLPLWNTESETSVYQVQMQRFFRCCCCISGFSFFCFFVLLVALFCLGLVLVETLFVSLFQFSLSLLYQSANFIK